MSRLISPLTVLLSVSCTGPVSGPDDPPPATPFPAADVQPEWRGPGGPSVTFPASELNQGCAYLTGGEQDWQHHNLVMPYRGHLVLPWAAEWGNGGLSFFEMADPCDPVKIGEGYHEWMRETHAIGFQHLPEDDPNAGDWTVVTRRFGVEIWDISDETNPVLAGELELPGVFYPDAYARVVFSVFWAYPYLYVAAADNGLFVVDTTDPREPELLTEYVFDTGLRAGGVFAIGDVLFVSSAEQTNAALLDISIPDDPQLFPGGLFEITDGAGESREAYHANLAGHWALFARKDGGGGPILFDITDPTDPTFFAEHHLTGGNGGYLFYDEGFVFQGDSNMAHIVDFTAMPDSTLHAVLNLTGDLDTAVPYGNVVVLSVDADADDGQATMVVPWTKDPDIVGPRVEWIRPEDGATGVNIHTAIGFGFNETVEPTSVFAGSIRVTADDGSLAWGWGGSQDAVGNYRPKQPLRRGTTYTVEVMQGGVRDLNNNAIAEPVTSTFTTAE